MQSPTHAPAEAGQAKNTSPSLELRELDLSTLSLQNDELADERPLTPISSTESSASTPPQRPRRVHSRTSSASDVWSPPVSPTRSARSYSSSYIPMMRPSPVPPPAQPTEYIRQCLGLRPAPRQAASEEEMLTPRPTTTVFPGFVNLEAEQKPIPSLIGPHALPYARNPSGIDAFTFEGTNLEPVAAVAFERPPSVKVAMVTAPKSPAARLPGATAQRSRGGQQTDRYSEAKAIQQEIERTKREVRYAIAVRNALQIDTATSLAQHSIPPESFVPASAMSAYSMPTYSFPSRTPGPTPKTSPYTPRAASDSPLTVIGSHSTAQSTDLTLQPTANDLQELISLFQMSQLLQARLAAVQAALGGGPSLAAAQQQRPASALLASTAFPAITTTQPVQHEAVSAYCDYASLVDYYFPVSNASSPALHANDVRRSSLASSAPSTYSTASEERPREVFQEPIRAALTAKGRNVPRVVDKSGGKTIGGGGKGNLATVRAVSSGPKKDKRSLTKTMDDSKQSGSSSAPKRRAAQSTKSLRA